MDTNYLRKLGAREYLEGKIPPKLDRQIASALKRGDIVCIPRTVQFELNAWVKEISQKEFDSIKRSMDVLLEKGYIIAPSVVEVVPDTDTLEIIKGKFSDVYILELSLENYIEAERRTSFREAPMPKNPQGEEFRDRLIWCQVLSQTSDLPSVIVSEDKIFENGVATQEGLGAKISILKTEEELNQWLDNRPDHMQKIIDDVLLFSNELKAQTVEIDEDEIARVVDYRAVNEPNGVILKKFLIVTTNNQGETISWPCKIYYQGKTPVSLSIQVNDHVVNIQRELTEDEQREVSIEKNTKVYEQQFREDELRRLIGG